MSWLLTLLVFLLVCKIRERIPYEWCDIRVCLVFLFQTEWNLTMDKSTMLSPSASAYSLLFLMIVFAFPRSSFDYVSNEGFVAQVPSPLRLSDFLHSSYSRVSFPLYLSTNFFTSRSLTPHYSFTSSQYLTSVSYAPSHRVFVLSQHFINKFCIQRGTSRFRCE